MILISVVYIFVGVANIEKTGKTIDEIIDDDSKFVQRVVELVFKLTKVEKRRIEEVELSVSYKE